MDNNCAVFELLIFFQKSNDRTILANDAKTWLKIWLQIVSISNYKPIDYWNMGGNNNYNKLVFLVMPK